MKAALTPSEKPRRDSLRHVRPADLKAAAQLATQATQGVINITEGVHQAVRRRLGFSPGASAEQASGLTGQIYQVVRGVTRLVGWGTDAALGALLPLVDDPATHPAASPEREAVLAALNGVLGDRLQSLGNPLAQAMELRQGGQLLPLAPALLKAQLGTTASPHLLLLIHGLSMNDTQWRRDGHDHGEFLSQALGCTPVYLRYNSGLHTSTNGHQLALMLERLTAVWPVPLERITLVGHSMGGLVARSALQSAREAGQRWPSLLRDMIFLGTPHHGAPLERAGHGVDLLLASSPHTAPFARLGKIRSAGITDLRHGHVQDADWQGRDRFESPDDHRLPLPLPEGVACFAVAATLAGRRGLVADRSHRSPGRPKADGTPSGGLAQPVLGAIEGDGLVPLNSALGQHDDPARRLVFAKGSQYIAYRTGHLDLLSSQPVAAQMLAWLSPAPSTVD